MFKYINCFVCSYTSKNKKQFAILKCLDIICRKCAVKGNEPNTIHCPFCKKSIKFMQLSDEMMTQQPIFQIDKHKKELTQKLNNLKELAKGTALIVEKMAEDESKLREKYMKVMELKKLAKERSEVSKGLHNFRVKIRKQLLQKQYEEKMKAAKKQINQ